MGTAALVAFGGLSALTVTPAMAAAPSPPLHEESFTGSSTKAGDWTTSSLSGVSVPCLTAATVTVEGSLPKCVKNPGKDPVGKGALQLTDNAMRESGGVVLNKALKASRGVLIQFDMYQYNGSGADGIAFFLIDGSVSPEIKSFGGTLGYLGLKGALLGIGFDAFGNYSYKFDETDSLAFNTRKPNSIVLRGTEADKWHYIIGRTLTEGRTLATSGELPSREPAKRSVELLISPSGFLTASMDFHDGKGRIVGVQDYKVPGLDKLPPSVKLGFGAATGDATNFHEITGLTVRELDPDLSTTVKPVGEFVAGGTGTFQIDVKNDPIAAPGEPQNKVEYTVPDGFTPKSATGDGWTCTTAGQKVTCTREDSLAPGSAFPPIKVEVNIPATAPSSITLEATANSARTDFKPADNTGSSGAVAIKPAPKPDVAVTTTPDGPFKAGSGGSTTTTVTSDPKGADPTGPTEVTITAPAGTTIASSEGTGWVCVKAADAKSVTCKRPDGLKAGESYPPIKTIYSIPSTTTGPLTIDSGVKSTGDGNPANDKHTTDSITVEPSPAPDLVVKTTVDGPFKAGDGGGTTTTVRNKPEAGPEPGPVEVTIGPLKEGTIDTIKGDGWTCTVTADKKSATCTRPDGLDPGKEYPPIKTTYKLPDTATGPITIDTVAKNKNDKDRNDNSHTTDPITPEPGNVYAGDITCHGGSWNAQFNPGVTFKRQTVQVQANGDLGICHSPKYPKITGGVIRFVGASTGACPGPFAIGYGKAQIMWSDGSKSVIPQATFRGEAYTWSLDGGSVSEGMFKGQTARAHGRSTTSAIEMGAQCVVGGLTAYSGAMDTFAIGAI